MALLGDRVQETTTSTGTGSITLNGAVTGYVTFNSTFSNGNSVWYVIDDGAGNWEIGYGTVGTGTLTRTVFQSSNANALVPFGVGTKRVFCTAPYTYLLPDQTGNSGKILTTDGTTSSWTTIASAGGVTSVSVASANGFAGTSSGGSTPALTLSTSISGILKGNGTAISAAVAGTDYAAANASFTLGSTSVSLGGTTTTVAGLTLTNPTINGFTGNTSVINIGSGQVYKDTSGNVGIGTSSPSAKLHVAGGNIRLNDNQGVEWGGATNFIYGSNSTNILAFATNNTVRATLDSSGNLGLGVTPSGWASSYKALQVGSAAGLVCDSTSSVRLYANAYYDGTSLRYINSDFATQYSQYQGVHRWFNAVSGTAGASFTFTQAMTLDASGNLGIGTTTINAKLHVNNATGGGSSSYFTDSTTGTSSGFQVGLDSGHNAILNMQYNAQMLFSTNNTERARIDSSGNLLVGTSVNNVYDSVAAARPLVVQSASSATTPGSSTNAITISNSDTTTNNVSQLNFAAITGASTSQYSSAWIACQYGARTNGQYPTGTLIFATSTTLNSAPSEKMRIDSSGQLQLGTTVAAGGKFKVLAGTNIAFGVQASVSISGSVTLNAINENNTANVPLDLRCSQLYVTSGITAGAGTNALKYNTSSNAFTYDTSSARYKNNIRDSVYGLGDVLQLRSAMFEYKSDGRTDVGLIAEEVFDVIPELVPLDSEGRPDAVSYDRMVSVLVKAVQELHVEIELLKAKVNT